MAYVIGTAGHVDHGKSTLVRALTGIDPDRLEEEKRREMTIDLGFAWMTLPGGESIGMVDVPGHHDFIENMLAGAGGIDLALFVVAADEGVMPQTREHLAILDLLGVQGGIITLTKKDKILDAEWLDLVSLDVLQVVRGTVLDGAPLIAVSARTGEGLDTLLASIEVALADRPPRPNRGWPRLPIDRVFTMSGFGTVVTGTLSGGTLAEGDEVEIQPSGKRARVRGLQNHREAVQSLAPGSRAAVNLAGIRHEDVRRGDVIAAPGLLHPTSLIDVQFRHLADAGRPLRHNAEVKFFSGAAESVAHVRLLGDAELPPGAEGWLQLRLTDGLALDKGDRFILRYPSPAQTIGGGVVVDAHPAHRWRRLRPEVLARLHTLAAGTPEEMLLHTLEGQTALRFDQAGKLAGLTEEEFTAVLGALEAHGEVLRLGTEWLAARASWARLAERVERELAAYHTQHPLKIGMPREALRSRLQVETRLFHPIFAYAIESGLIVEAGTLVHAAGFQVAFSAAVQAAIEQLWRAIREQPDAPPSVKEAAALVGEDVLQALIDRGDVRQASAEVLFDAETYAAWIGQIETFIRNEGSITVAQARDLLGTTRKYVLALLEHLDEQGVTRRVGDERVLRDKG